MTNTPQNQEPAEADVVHLLGVYADALETRAAAEDTEASPRGVDPMTGVRSSTLTGQSERKLESGVLDIETAPVDHRQPGRGRVVIGALAVAAAVVVGGILLSTGNGSSEVDVADVADGEQSELTDSAATRTEPTQDESASESIAPSASADFGFGPGHVIFADGEFVSIGSEADRVVVARSTNGTDWSTTPVNGLPEGAVSFMLARIDSGWVSVVEIWPAAEEADTGPFPLDVASPERLLATSTDLVEWTTAELPDLGLDDDVSSWVVGLAGSGDRVAIMFQIQPDEPDELRILFDAGLISEADLGRYCGSDFIEGGPFIGYSCEFGVEVTADVESDGAVESGPPTTVGPIPAEEPERQELLRVEPGDPGYDALEAIYSRPPDTFLQAPIIVSGPAGGPFEVTELPIAGYSSSLVGTAGGFVAAVLGGPSTELLSSPDGADWQVSGQVVDGADPGFIATSGDRLLGISSARGETLDGGTQSWISDDQGATWTSGSIDTQLFGAYGIPVGGPAGFAVLLTGSTGPYEDPFTALGSVNIAKDGYTMVMDLGSSFSSLLGPDGAVIHDSVSLQDVFEGGAENVARSEEFDSVIVWLDPETGEDLVSISEDDFDAAFEEAFGEDPSTIGSDFEEPDLSSEIWFSSDGITWTLLEQIDGLVRSSVSAVGDDEVLVRDEVFLQPPDELVAFEREGREPSAEELAELEAFYTEQAGSSSSWRSIMVG